MTGFGYLIAAAIAFAGGHVALSSQPLREPLIKRLGDGGFLALYSVYATTTFVWLVSAFNAAPRDLAWTPPGWLAWPTLVMLPAASILLVAGLTTRNVTLGGARSGGDVGDPAPGIMRITRHPMLWAFVLWALTHLLANGEWASIILMVAIMALAFAGMAHIDAKRQRSMGSAWGPIALGTSVIPFAALASGRAKFDWLAIGWTRVLGGLALYAALLLIHPWVIGVDPLAMAGL